MQSGFLLTCNAIVPANNAIVSADNAIVSTNNAIVSTDNAIASIRNRYLKKLGWGKIYAKTQLTNVYNEI
ncbi:hypothetical protein [Nostoc sp. DedSLP04]|uniref:hypothetical protein n=1 Tax=Nostoc sp. DedSLP04 TaxID=3075401 RepID=UPI002AD27B9A|nr:hypothetical protein [Nostoc sp. DedSLP04]MDZ8035975.1 hypothetical protein [Nostoc sp. DedSLP04]